MKVVGVMSGTSVDGIDVALCDINGSPPRLEATILAADTIPYSNTIRARILATCSPGTVDELCRLNFEIGNAISQAIRCMVDDLSEVDLIASHGQTIWHDVTAEGHVSSTLQIGAAAVIAEQTGVTTINNFRTRDVAAGGHGAPLTAYADWLLLRHDTKWRAVQNIGGMGNVSFLPPITDTSHTLIAFDTGPGNALIDAVMYELSNQTTRYDGNGQMAATGTVDTAWLATMLEHPYFSQVPPRSTGRELFGSEMAMQLLHAGKERGLSDADIIATLTTFTAQSIACAYQDFAPSMPAEVIIGGGGVHNKTLLKMLSNLLTPATVMTHEAIGLSSDYKEALVFAILGYETWHHRTGTLPGQTGATHATVLGQITPGQNYMPLIKDTWR